MASNSFGKHFRMTTWGESHGPAIGCVIDGCPAGLSITEQEIQQSLDLRRPGRCAHVSPRQERDSVQILSGVFEGKTTGAPISLVIKNEDADSSKYEAIKELLRPGHANFTYLAKYGHFDHRGGGRASARETACRVAAGAIAEKLLQMQGIQIVAYLKALGKEEIASVIQEPSHLMNAISASEIFCPSVLDEARMIEVLNAVKAQGDSVGGVVECIAFNVPPGLGDPIYEKIEAKLASAMMSLPASKAFEMGDGVAASKMLGSEHNDSFISANKQIRCATNHAGGTLGGITTGEPLVMRIHFKPASSIQKPQQTVDMQGNPQVFTLPQGSRHDPSVVIRAVPVCKAMCALVLADFVKNNLFTKNN